MRRTRPRGTERRGRRSRVDIASEQRHECAREAMDRSIQGSNARTHAGADRGYISRNRTNGHIALSLSSPPVRFLCASTDGVVGYHVRLTRERSAVRTRLGVQLLLFFFLLPASRAGAGCSPYGRVERRGEGAAADVEARGGAPVFRRIRNRAVSPTANATRNMCFSRRLAPTRRPRRPAPLPARSPTPPPPRPRLGALCPSP